jgi:hypothetical protein
MSTDTEDTFESSYLQDTLDARDVLYEPASGIVDALTSSTSAISVLPVTTPISQQEGVGSCVTNAVCDGFELLAGRADDISVVHSLEAAKSYLNDDVAEPIQISRLFPFFFSRMAHGAECDSKSGTYPRTALSAGSRIGFCTEKMWPYDPSMVNVRPTLEAISEAYDHRINTYRSIPRGSARDMGERVRAAIREGLPVIHGKPVGKEYLNAYDILDEKTVIEPPTNILGHHATLIVGYRQQGDGSYVYLDRNSHGSRYGLLALPGHIWISEEYLSLAVDLWVPTVAWQPSSV